MKYNGDQNQYLSSANAVVSKEVHIKSCCSFIGFIQFIQTGRNSSLYFSLDSDVILPLENALVSTQIADDEGYLICQQTTECIFYSLENLSKTRFVMECLFIFIVQCLPTALSFLSRVILVNVFTFSTLHLPSYVVLLPLYDVPHIKRRVNSNFNFFY